MSTFRNFSVYGKSGRKAKFMTDATLEGESNAETIIVDGDVAGSSMGVPTSSASIDYAISAEGEDSSQVMYDLWDSGEWTKFTFGMIDGRILSAEMMVKSFKYTGKAANGTTTFSCQLIGKKPQKVG